MSDAQLNDVGHENALTRGDIVAATAIAQFYNFASRCMNWAKTPRSLQERALYVQMGLQWLAAGARLQTFLQFKSSQDVSLRSRSLSFGEGVAASGGGFLFRTAPLIVVALTRPPYGTSMPQSGRRPQHQKAKSPDVSGMPP